MNISEAAKKIISYSGGDSWQGKAEEYIRQAIDAETAAKDAEIAKFSKLKRQNAELIAILQRTKDELLSAQHSLDWTKAERGELVEALKGLVNAVERYKPTCVKNVYYPEYMYRFTEAAKAALRKVDFERAACFRDAAARIGALKGAEADEAEWADTLSAARQKRQLDALVAEKVMGAKYEAETIPHYSTDIAAAWMVVDRVRRLGITIHWNDNSKTWGVFIGGRDAADESLSLAICKAAIEAMGGKS